MGEPLNKLRSRHDQITIPTIWVAFVLSLILHAAAFLGRLPLVPHLPFTDQREGKPEGSLQVRLAPPPSPPKAVATPRPEVHTQTPPQPTPRPRHAPGRASKRPAPNPAPKVLAMQSPEPSLTQSPIPAPPPADPAPAPAYADLASMIEARRRARAPASPPQAQGKPAAPAETEQERHNRIVADSLGLTRTPGFGGDRKPGGGIFQIKNINYYDAEFVFFGWNKDIRRNSQQVIEVRRGTNASIQIAIVRRMIAIIRENTMVDFLWESPRLGRNVTLSARSEDNAGLEDFMMREFFPETRARP
jgi:hypothetical protein